MKNPFLFLLLFLVSQNTFCQENGSDRGLFLRGKLESGTTRFKLTDDFQDAFMYENETSYEFRPVLGFSGGVGVGYGFSDRFSLFTEVSFERSGYQFETIDNFVFTTPGGDELVGLVKFEETINRISFPLLARVKVLGDRGGLTATFGPDFNIGLAGKGNAVLYDGVKTVPVAPSTDFSLGGSRFDEYVGFNVGFVLGLGLVVPLNPDNDLRLTIDARRKWGFTDQYTDARRNYLCQTEGACIQGSKFLRGTYFSIGVEKSFGYY